MDNISNCDDEIVGAGPVVVQDLNFIGTYVGNLVRKVK